MKLSQHFNLYEFTRSQTAARLGIDNMPSDDAIDNLQRLCLYFLEPLREAVDSPITINSGYRCLLLNKAIGGSLTSSHMDGEAADIIVAKMKPRNVCKVIRDLDVTYDQNIHEFGQWTHLGIGSRFRKQDLTAYRKEGKTIYTPGIHKIKDLLDE